MADASDRRGSDLLTFRAKRLPIKTAQSELDPSQFDPADSGKIANCRTIGTTFTHVFDQRAVLKFVEDARYVGLRPLDQPTDLVNRSDCEDKTPCHPP